VRDRLIECRVSAAQLSQCVPCGLRIHQVGSLHRTQPSAHPRQQRLTMCNPQTQRIDRFDIQPLRLLQDPPPVLFRIPERRPRQRYPLVFISRRLGRTRRFFQMLQHPRPHLRRRRARKGDRQNLLGLIYNSEQLQKSPRQ